MKNFTSRLFFVLSIIGIHFVVDAQSDIKLIDKIVAVVGDNIILKSEVELQYQQYASQQAVEVSEEFKCDILDQMLRQKMMLHQAEIDSIQVNDEEIEAEMDRRLRYFISLIGSEKKLEEEYNKSIVEIKDDFREDIKKQLLANRMQASITSDVKITPAEVKKFYNNIAPDSLPYFNAEMEVGQIVIYPKTSQIQKTLAKEKIQNLRDRIIAGEDFSTMAVIYSEDPGSASNGGELGFTKRGELVSAFEAVAYSIKKEEVSEIIETQFGYHILQLIERRGETVNVRHILIKPQITSYDIKAAQALADSVSQLISSGQMSFPQAVAQFSEDEDTKNSSGMLTNNQTGTTYFEADQMDPSIYFMIDKMKPGEVSTPSVFTTQTGKQAYRLLYLKSETEPHQASLKEDYNKIQAAALNEKKTKAMEEWLREKSSATYIHIDPIEGECIKTSNWIQPTALGN